MKLPLPEAVRCVAAARDTLRDLYRDSGLKFTPDGKFVGDIGEAVAAEMFGITLKQGPYIDGYSPCHKPVQIKATGREKGGAQFRRCDSVDAKLIHLLVFYIDWSGPSVEVLYNGPEDRVRDKIRGQKDQREVSRSTLMKLDQTVEQHERLQLIDKYKGRLASA